MSSTVCKRCGCAARGGDGNPDARMLRRARTGVCVDCGVVLFLQKLSNMHVAGAVDQALPDALRLPHVRAQFVRVIAAGRADAQPGEIDWERVIELWDIEPKTTGVLF